MSKNTAGLHTQPSPYTSMWTHPLDRSFPVIRVIVIILTFGFAESLLPVLLLKTFQKDHTDILIHWTLHFARALYLPSCFTTK